MRLWKTVIAFLKTVIAFLVLAVLLPFASAEVLNASTCAPPVIVQQPPAALNSNLLENAYLIVGFVLGLTVGMQAERWKPAVEGLLKRKGASP